MFLTRLALLGITLCLPVTVAGCARTDDGTVVIPPSMDMRRAWQRNEPAVQTPPVESGNQVFPIGPEARPVPSTKSAMSRKKPRRHARTTSSRPVPQLNGQSSSPIACGQARQADGRVHVVCQ